MENTVSRKCVEQFSCVAKIKLRRLHKKAEFCPIVRGAQTHETTQHYCSMQS